MSPPVRFYDPPLLGDASIGWGRASYPTLPLELGVDRNFPPTDRRLFRFWYTNGEGTFLEFCLGFFSNGIFGEVESAPELAVSPFRPMADQTSTLLSRGSFSVDGQCAVLEAHMDIFFAHFGQVCLQCVLLVILYDLDFGCPVE